MPDSSEDLYIKNTSNCYKLVIVPVDFLDAPPKAPMFLSGFDGYIIPQQIYIQLYNIDIKSRNRPYLQYTTIKLGKVSQGYISLVNIFEENQIELIKINNDKIYEYKDVIIAHMLMSGKIISYDDISDADKRYKNVLDSRYQIKFIERVVQSESHGYLYCTIMERYSAYINPIKIDIKNFAEEVREKYVFGKNEEALKYFILNFFHQEVIKKSMISSKEISQRKKVEILIRFFLENNRWGRKARNKDFIFDSSNDQTSKPSTHTTPSKQLISKSKPHITPETPFGMVRIGKIVTESKKIRCFSEVSPDNPFKYVPRVSSVQSWISYPYITLPKINHKDLESPIKTPRKTVDLDIRKERTVLNTEDTGIARWEACHVYAHRFMQELGKDPHKDNIVLGTDCFNTSMMYVEDAISVLRIKYLQELSIWIEVGFDGSGLPKVLVYHVSRFKPNFVADSKTFNSQIEDRPHFQMNFNAAVNSHPALGLQRPIFEAMEACLFPEPSLSLCSLSSISSAEDSSLLSPMSCGSSSSLDSFSSMPPSPMSLSPELSPDLLTHTVTSSSSDSDRSLSDDHDPLSQKETSQTYLTPIRHKHYDENSPRGKRGTPGSKRNSNESPAKQARGQLSDSVNILEPLAELPLSNSVNAVEYPLAELPLSPSSMPLHFSPDSGASTFFSNNSLGVRRTAVRSLNSAWTRPTVPEQSVPQPCQDDPDLSDNFLELSP